MKIHGVEFLFCDKRCTARKIIEILTSKTDCAIIST
jgi:hypothetical protein